MGTVDVEATPIGLDEPGPGGFSGNDVLARIGARTYEADDSSARNDLGGTLATYAPFTVAVVPDDASAEWLTVEGVDELLRVEVGVEITDPSGAVDVRGREWAVATELTDAGIQWSGGDGVADRGGLRSLTGRLPAALWSAAEAEMDRTRCRDEAAWGEGELTLHLEQSLDEPRLLAGLTWPDDTEDCPLVEYYDSLVLAPSAAP